MMLHPDDEDWNIALTTSWDNFDSFIDALELAVTSRYLVPCDIYLIYDDKETYKNTIRALLKSEWIQQFFPDWWRIVYD